MSQLKQVCLFFVFIKLKDFSEHLRQTMVGRLVTSSHLEALEKYRLLCLRLTS